MSPAKPTKKINLALQGGGAHGAFTWGVLDRLLEDERIEIEGISGTSAGAMNAALVAEGIMEGGTAGARAAMERFWQAISRAGMTSPLQSTWWDKLQKRWSLDDSPLYVFFDMMSRMFSPYDFNPFNMNPLQDILAREIDFSRIHDCQSIRLFICTTHVTSGRAHVFTNEEITLDVLLASACLPFLFQAVEINGEPHWDGGYMGNPSLYPLFKCDSRDVLIVQINPIMREGTPRRARDIINRVNEISFNSSLIQELRAIEFVSHLLDEERIPPTRYKRMLIHRVEADDVLLSLGASSKFNTDWKFLCYLRDVGRDAADLWLRAHYDALGEHSTLDVQKAYLKAVESSRLTAGKR